MLLWTLPRFESLDLVQCCWILHPLDGLVGRHKVHVLSLGHIVHEALEGFQVLWVSEPRRVEVETIGRPIRGKVAVEVVHKHPVDVLSVHIRWTTVYHSTGVASTGFQLIHHHLPDARVAPSGTVLVVSRALVRHFKVQGVGPERRIRMGRHHGGVVLEAKLLHHKELAVPADPQERHADAADLLHAHVPKPVDDVSLAHHLIEPVLDGGVVRPPRLRCAVTVEEGEGGGSLINWRSQIDHFLWPALLLHCIRFIAVR